MKQSRTVFLTTIFPASENYLDDFFTSLQKQTCKDFDILVVNDGVEGFHTTKENYSDLNINEIKPSFSPSKNREIGIKKAVELGYEHIVFGDSDDYFTKNRVEESINALKQNDIVINELTIIKGNSTIDFFLSNNLKCTNALHNDILNSNVFGFSNTAVNASIIPLQFVFENNIIAVDWFFISLLLLQKKQRIRFLKNVQTYYRQHSNNTVGISTTVNEKKIDLGLSVKHKHYTALFNYCIQNKSDNYSKILKNKLQEIHQLREKLLAPSFKIKYLKAINANMTTIFSGWWSEIITLKEFEKYESTANN